jgi:hypothetical protein
MTNYRSLVPGGFYSWPGDPKRGTKACPASVWSNNPGAVNGAQKGTLAPIKWVQEFPGFVKVEVIGGGNPIAIFETPEQGIALWLQLMIYYRQKGVVTLEGIINRYGGGQDYSAYIRQVSKWTGFPTNKVIDLNNDAVVIPFFKAMKRYEAGIEAPWSDEQIAYGFNLVRKSQPTPKPSVPVKRSDFASQVLGAMEVGGYPVVRGTGYRNSFYIEGMDPDGTPNANRRNAWDDLRGVLEVGDDGVPRILGAWEATIETGEYFTHHRINPKGAARIAFGHHKDAWIRGKHSGYDAFVQQGGKVKVYRDDNEDFSREGDDIDIDYFGINQHHGGNAPRDNIGKHSAGCLVGRTTKGHAEYMQLMTEDLRYQANPGFKFSTTILKAAEVTGVKPKPPVTPVDATVTTTVTAGGIGIAAWLGAHWQEMLVIGIALGIFIGVGIHLWRKRKDN